MLEWPGRCGICGLPIDDWAEAGADEKRWVHKACYSRKTIESTQKGVELPPLRSPIERSKQLEWPMLASLLLFHFGIGIAFIGWIMLTQDIETDSDPLGIGLLAVGLVMTVVGITGTALNVLSRRRIELVRHALDISGGWRATH